MYSEIIIHRIVAARTGTAIRIICEPLRPRQANYQVNTTDRRFAEGIATAAATATAKGSCKFHTQ